MSKRDLGGARADVGIFFETLTVQASAEHAGELPRRGPHRAAAKWLVWLLVLVWLLGLFCFHCFFLRDLFGEPPNRAQSEREAEKTRAVPGWPETANAKVIVGADLVYSLLFTQRWPTKQPIFAPMPSRESPKIGRETLGSTADGRNPFSDPPKSV